MDHLITPAHKHCDCCSKIVQTQAKQLPGICLLSRNLSCGFITPNMPEKEVMSYIHNTFHIVEDHDVIVRHMLMSTTTLELLLRNQEARKFIDEANGVYHLWTAEIVEYALQPGHFMCLGMSIDADWGN